MGENFNKCRACLAEDEPMLLLFEEYEHNITLADILQLFVSAEIHVDDGLPSHICDNCIQVLVQFYNFSVIYEKSQNRLLEEREENVKLKCIQEQSQDSDQQDDLIWVEENDSESSKFNPDDFIVSDVDSVTSSSNDNFVIGSEDSEFKQYANTKENGVSSKHDQVLSKTFICAVCGKRFTRKSYLKAHMESHSDEKKYKCKFCGKSFKRRTVLRAHIRLHTHPKHYVCEHCGTGFTARSNLKSHQDYSHVGERKFKCEFCSMAFSLKSTLNKHTIRHEKRANDVRDFKCNYCDMEYRDKSSLKRHFKTKHFGKSEETCCSECKKVYINRSSLIRHQKKFHS